MQSMPPLSFLLATWFGLGKLPKAPGTYGSLGALPFAWVLQSHGGPLALGLALLILCPIALWAMHPSGRKGERLLCGLFPLAEQVAKGPLPVRMLSLWMHPYCYLCTPLLRAPTARATLGADELIAWSRERMAAYKVPCEVEFVASLPKSATGKIDWRLLQEQEAARR